MAAQNISGSRSSRCSPRSPWWHGGASAHRTASSPRSSLALPLSVPSERFPLLSLPRFGLGRFPVFLALATLGGRPRAHTAILGTSALLLGVAHRTVGAVAMGGVHRARHGRPLTWPVVSWSLRSRVGSWLRDSGRASGTSGPDEDAALPGRRGRPPARVHAWVLRPSGSARIAQGRPLRELLALRRLRSRAGVGPALRASLRLRLARGGCRSTRSSARARTRASTRSGSHSRAAPARARRTPSTSYGFAPVLEELTCRGVGSTPVAALRLAAATVGLGPAVGARTRKHGLVEGLRSSRPSDSDSRACAAATASSARRCARLDFNARRLSSRSLSADGEPSRPRPRRPLPRRRTRRA